MTAENREFCDAWLAAWTFTGGDLEKAVDALLVFYADDVFYSDPSRPQGINGLAAFRKHATKLLAGFGRWRYTVVELHPIPNGFAVKWRVELGDRVCFGVDLVERNPQGNITRNEVYFDRAALFDMTGQ